MIVTDRLDNKLQSLKKGADKMDQEKTLFDELSQDRESYIMRNASNGVEIKCTRKFMDYWKKRGFVIVGKGSLRLID